MKQFSDDTKLIVTTIQKLNGAISKKQYLDRMEKLRDQRIIIIFDECLHKYVITDAIKDENVLKFSVEYVGRYRQKDESKTNIDILMNILIVVTLVSEYDTVGCDFVLKERINQF